MNPNINFYGIVILLRKLRECASAKEIYAGYALEAAENQSW